MQNKTYLSFYKTPQGEIALKKNNQLMIKLGKTSWSYYDFDKNKNDHLDTLAHLMRKSWVKGELMLCLLMIFEEYSQYFEIKSICRSMIKELRLGGDDNAK